MRCSGVLHGSAALQNQARWRLRRTEHMLKHEEWTVVLLMMLGGESVDMAHVAVV